MRDLMLPARPLLLAVLFFLSAYLSSCIAGDALTPGQPLLDDGQTLISAGGSFALGFFSPTGSKNRYVGIWYNRIPTQTIVWIANRRVPVNDTTGSLSVNGNGSLIITAQKSTAVWSTAPVANSVRSPVARLLDSGNFVVEEAGGGGGAGPFAWQSFDLPTDTLLPGMKLGWDLAAGLSRNLTSWAGPADPSPGPYALIIDVRGDPQVFLTDGSTPVWRGGPWDGLRLAGLPEMGSAGGPFNFTFVNSGGEVYYSYTTLDAAVVARLAVNSTGSAQRLVWVNETQQWNVFWQAPADQCDAVSVCGPYGLCDVNDSPVCSCIQGFKPKLPANWALRDGSDGCVRKTALECPNGTDGFVLLAGAKIPDTSSATVNESIGLEECGARCLRNCLCTGYASKNVRGGVSGCVMWSSELTDMRVYQSGGQDLYVRLAAADLGWCTCELLVD